MCDWGTDGRTMMHRVDLREAAPRHGDAGPTSTAAVYRIVCGTVPIVSFWAERRATARVRAEYPDLVPSR